MLLHDTIYHHLRRAVLTCELLPGQDLHKETLAKQFRVSCSVIQDTLCRLEQANLVTSTVQKHYRVKSLSQPDLEDVFSLRILVETSCAIAAAGAHDTALRSLDRFRQPAGYADNPADLLQIDQSFHTAIADLSGNPHLTATARDLIRHLDRLQGVVSHLGDEAAIHVTFRQHEAIIDALQAHDPQRAARLCAEHLQAKLTLIAASLQSS